MIQQVGNPLQGTILFIMAVTILTAIGISLLKIVITKFVSLAIEKKKTNDEKIETEARKFAVVFFIVLSGLILIIGQNQIAVAFNRPPEEVMIAGFLIIVFGLLISGLIYRKTSQALYKKMRGYT